MSRFPIHNSSLHELVRFTSHNSWFLGIDTTLVQIELRGKDKEGCSCGSSAAALPPYPFIGPWRRGRTPSTTRCSRSPEMWCERRWPRPWWSDKVRWYLKGPNMKKWKGERYLNGYQSCVRLHVNRHIYRSIQHDEASFAAVKKSQI